MNGQKIQKIQIVPRASPPPGDGAHQRPRRGPTIHLSPRRPSFLAAVAAITALVLICAGIPATIMYLAWELWP